MNKQQSVRGINEIVHKLQFLLASRQFQKDVKLHNVLFPR